VNVYKMAQETAKRARINIWKMGDPGDSDDDNY
jgi:endonuclease YncB( thermonuclease family)